jgi:formamidopyrimidine-DNA glycosylase
VPEILEVEFYARAAQAAIGRTVQSVTADDAWYLKRTDADAVRGALVGSAFTAVRRRGKLLMLDTSNGSVLGLRFGMTGRLVVDGNAAIDELLYSSHRPDPSFDRFALTFDDGGRLAMSDPRRLGGVELDPDPGELGADALTLTLAELQHALASSTAPLKARLMDQSRIAGIGNLLADEILWRAKLSPRREAGALSRSQLSRLHEQIAIVTQQLLARGGSHLGDLMDARVRGGHCPRCGAGLSRDTVGGRTTYWCRREQR